jgi:hypothetical protein
MTTVLERPGSFGERHFGGCRLGDRRRTRRLVALADRLLAHPEGPLPRKLHSPADYRALCRLANRPSVTHAAVLRPHRRLALRQAREQSGVVLLLHDTTELDYSGQATLALGPIGNGGGRGYECHNSLAVDAASGRVLGLAHQILHRRATPPPGEGRAAKRARPDRESRLWTAAVKAIGPAPPGRLWVDVCDRGADLFEFLAHEHAHGRSYVVRSSQSRVVQGGDGLPRLLHDRLRRLPAAARWEVRVAARPGRPARTARVAAGSAAVVLPPPRNRRGEYAAVPLRLWGARVWEEQPPPGAEPLEWLLLTNVPIGSPGQLRERVGWYERRPLVEEYHKAQKTGANIEGLQFQSRAGLEPVIALLSVVAVALVNLRAAARMPDQAGRPAASAVDPLWVKVLSVWRHGAARDLTVGEFTLALARLGGHQNRKCDGLPGWQTLWRGWNQLHAMISYELSRQGCGKH